MKKTVTHLADGRELIYFDSGDAEALAAYPDTRSLDPVVTSSETRYDPVLGEWVAVAAHRQGRIYHPPAANCPLCPSTAAWQSEIPAPRYEVVVFENRFPSLAGTKARPSTSAAAEAQNTRWPAEDEPAVRELMSLAGAAAGPAEGAHAVGSSVDPAPPDGAGTGVALIEDPARPADGSLSLGRALAASAGHAPVGHGAGAPIGQSARTADDEPIQLSRSGAGRCEVVCFTSEHDSSFARLSTKQVGLVLEAWTDRTAQLSALPGIRQVYCFENRGTEIGVTLSHPHGQIYAFPYVTPKTQRALANAAQYRERHGRNLFEDLLETELAGPRVVVDSEHWVAFVPFAAHWPYEVHLYPRRRVADFTGLDDGQRADFPHVYLELLRRFDRLFDRPQPTPYIAAWHQAPVRAPGERTELALHLELFTVQRTADKLKYLAGTESGMGAFMNDVSPERAAAQLREVSIP
ncbi:MAG TPA: galactose-1-phosphate uridylyltransferase [Actinocrinis sp.]|nr:galactose-1-phosphate uridylyltransferase [Actinocrinis sp.]